MANQWFKFYGSEYLCDPKMKSLSPCDRSCWLTILCHASVSEIEGVIKHLSEKQLMLDSGIDFQKDEWKETTGVIDRFVQKEMILVDNGMITVKNWNKKQEKTLTPYERVKKYRMKQDNVLITSDNNDNNDDNDRIEENRIDKNREEKDTSVFSLFWNKYPKKELKKKTQEIWKRKKLDSQLKEILAFIEKASATDRWKRGFIKQPPAFLNGECWNDDLKEYNDRVGSKREVLEAFNPK